MPADMVVLVATAVLACVAVIAALVALRAARQVARHQAGARPAEPAKSVADPGEVAVRAPELADDVPREVRVVEGRVIVPPSREEVVSTALSRPQVRFAVLLHGVARALRPESRDRIGALVRREYRDRRRHRLRAGRQASRAAHLAASPTPPSAHWLGEAADAPQDRAIGA